MSTHALEHAPAATDLDERPEPGDIRRGLLGLLALGVALVAAAVLLGARTWQVGSGLGAAFFPVEDIVELAAVAVGTVAAGWTGAHALLALACVLAGQRGRRWAAGERAVARNAPSVVLRLARVAAGAGVGLALAAPTAMALPHDSAVPAADAGPAVVLDLGWRPTDGSSGKSAGPQPATERSSLVARSAGTDERTVVVEAGDTLWSIAADGLAREAEARAGAGSPAGTPTAAEIVDAVGRWYETNRAVLGADPDLIRPGMVLREP
ncbi:LysM peptidoglycan-binding domain-containing protein [Promicromonospora sukumoe]|uniref:LysM peptidoglycan-binding domain-containing protein n=1 Tax=Promicromonospora sukumoe TaxID=88382 RepID=UPI00364AD308